MLTELSEPTSGWVSRGSGVTDDMYHDPMISGTIKMQLNRSSMSIGGPLEAL